MKNKIIIIGFYFILICFFLISIFDTDSLISKTERRNLAQFPTIEISSLLDGSFFNKINEYTVDHFPFRERFIQQKITFLNKIYQKKENHDAYIKNNTIYQLEPTININSVSYFTEKLNSIYKQYFPKKQVFYAIIPDKNYYASDSSFPKLNYDKFYKLVRNSLNNSFLEIDLRDSLSLNSYYKTDLHWKQETLKPVLQTLQKEMKLPPSSFPTNQNTFFPFYGAYYGKSAGSIKADTLIYLNSNTIKSTQVYNYEKNEIQEVYKKENLQNIDPYDIFLDGATPILILENQKSENNKQLIIFRDSFASSLAPLLLENYNSIILIDLRYFSSNLLSNITEIDFSKENQDILFLYSVPIINQSFTLK